MRGASVQAMAAVLGFVAFSAGAGAVALWLGAGLLGMAVGIMGLAVAALGLGAAIWSLRAASRQGGRTHTTVGHLYRAARRSQRSHARLHRLRQALGSREPRG